MPLFPPTLRRFPVRLAVLFVGILVLHLRLLSNAAHGPGLWHLGTGDGATEGANVIHIHTRALPAPDAIPTPTTATPEPLTAPAPPSTPHPTAPASPTPADDPHASATAPASAAPGVAADVPLDIATAAPPPAAEPTPPEPSAAIENAPGLPAAQAQTAHNNTDSAAAPPSAESLNYLFPAPVQLNYDLSAVVNRSDYSASATLVWQHDGSNYQANLVARKFGFVKLREWGSKGMLTSEGLAPLRYSDKSRSEVVAHFVREQGKVIFSANTPELALLPGAQDKLSAILQLSSLMAGTPSRLLPGDSITFQTINDRYAETWTFVVGAPTTVRVPGGTFETYKLTRTPTEQYSTQAELWLAPAMDCLPVHIRLSETNGNVLDMVWTDSQKP